MKYIKKEELITGEIYKSNITDNVTYIMKATENLLNVINITSYHQFMKNGSFNSSLLTFTNATYEEKHWLEVCIAADKFITYNEAMKTSIPEYVECIEPNNWKQTIRNNNNNLIFDTKNESVHLDYNNWKNIIKIMSTPFKPSTKEAYDAQFIVKEPKFILPEKWCIKITNENLQFCKNLKNKELHFHKGYSYNVNGYYSSIGNKIGSFGFCNIPINYTEITFEQFKKYVLKEETAIEFGNKIDKEIIKPLPQFKVIETIETITKVENNEGNQFFIGDKINTPLNNIVRIISSFTYNQDKTELYANFEETLDVVNINIIEHYIETKSDFILPEKWGILRTSENNKIVTDYINKQYDYNHSYLNYNRNNPYLHNKYGCSSSYKLFTQYTEITFDQFKKYVLKETVDNKSKI